MIVTRMLFNSDSRMKDVYRWMNYLAVNGPHSFDNPVLAMMVKGTLSDITLRALITG